MCCSIRVYIMWDHFTLPQLLCSSNCFKFSSRYQFTRLLILSVLLFYARVQSMLYVLLSVCKSRTVVHPRVPARHWYQVANTAMFLYTASVGSKAGVARGRETKNWHNQGFNRGWQMQEMGRVYLS